MLLFNNLFEKVESYLTTDHRVTYLVAPFITPSVLAHLAKERIGKRVVVLTSWRKDHLLSGVSSLATYTLCKDNGWTLFINGALHMKLFSRDLNTALVGSANITGRGLGLGTNYNHEVLVESKLNSADRVHIHKLINNSVFVNDSIYTQYSDWYAAQEKIKLPQGDLKLSLGTKEFLSSGLPHSRSPSRLHAILQGEVHDCADWEVMAAEHDQGLYCLPSGLDRESFLALLQVSFFSSWQVTLFLGHIGEEGMYFGEMSALLHDMCTDVPAPYRSEIKSLLQSIIEWSTELQPTLFIVDVPGRRSQRFRCITK